MNDDKGFQVHGVKGAEGKNRRGRWETWFREPERGTWKTLLGGAAGAACGVWLYTQRTVPLVRSPITGAPFELDPLVALVFHILGGILVLFGAVMFVVSWYDVVIVPKGRRTPTASVLVLASGLAFATILLRYGPSAWLDLAASPPMRLYAHEDGGRLTLYSTDGFRYGACAATVDGVQYGPFGIERLEDRMPITTEDVIRAFVERAGTDTPERRPASLPVQQRSFDVECRQRRGEYAEWERGHWVGSGWDAK
ncbi:MAG: hypothetical protein ACRDHY_00910 [Anaerolineales bacterium]